MDMELKGIKGPDSVIAEIKPQLNVPSINLTGDSVRTIITLNRDGQYVEWYHMDNLDGDLPTPDKLKSLILSSKVKISLSLKDQPSLSK